MSPNEYLSSRAQLSDCACAGGRGHCAHHEGAQDPAPQPAHCRAAQPAQVPLPGANACMLYAVVVPIMMMWFDADERYQAADRVADWPGVPGTRRQGPSAVQLSGLAPCAAFV